MYVQRCICILTGLLKPIRRLKFLKSNHSVSGLQNFFTSFYLRPTESRNKLTFYTPSYTVLYPDPVDQEAGSICRVVLVVPTPPPAITILLLSVFLQLDHLHPVFLRH